MLAVTEASNLAIWTFLTLIAGFIWQGWRENRQRNWDRQDREDAAKRSKAERAEVAAKVETVSATLEKNTANTDKKLDQIHELTNGAMTVQLEMYKTLARQLADVTKDPGHI